MRKKISKLIKCRDCGKQFDPKEKIRVVRQGYYNQCVECSLKMKDVPRYLGRQGLTNKDGSIEIFRDNLNFVSKVLKRETSAGYGANLILGSPKSKDLNEE